MVFQLVEGISLEDTMDLQKAKKMVANLVCLMVEQMELCLESLMVQMILLGVEMVWN